EVLGEAPASAEPSEGSLNDPAPGQELEPFDAWRSLDDLDRPRAGECIDELFAAINPVGKDMSQPWEAAMEVLQQGNGTMYVLNVGGMNIYGQQQTVGIGHDVALAAVKALAGVKAARATRLRRRSCLTVDDGRRWLQLAAEPAPRSPDQ